MTIIHHPSDIVLAEFASSRLDEAAALVVGVHVTQCAQCQRAIRDCEMVSGALLDDSAPTPMLADDPDALLERADAPAHSVIQNDTFRTAQHSTADVSSPPVNRLLSLYDAGKWRWAGPGVHWRPLSVPSEENIRVFMMKAAGGVRLPDHRHSGIEWTCVLEGAFTHAHGRFGPGDFDEADPDIDHDPVVEAGKDCVCIVAMNGRLELQGLFGKIMQPFVRF